ncbi:MAG: BtpA/SgcQ family protein [Bradymonadia bacterium]
MRGLITAGGTTLIGMVHLRPLPGSAGWNGDVDALVQAALTDATALVAGGCDALIVENMGDTPYLKGHVFPETVAAMTVATRDVVGLGVPTGVQVLAGANREALGVALASGAHFIRVEGFAYAHVADEGWIDACAAELVRARSMLGTQIEIWADIQKKHAAHAVTQDLSLADWVHGADFCGADGVIVTGGRTGLPPDPAALEALQGQRLPVAVGSGVTADNIGEYVGRAAAVIVGSALKYDGHWRNAVDEGRVKRVRDALDRALG